MIGTLVAALLARVREAILPAWSAAAPDAQGPPRAPGGGEDRQAGPPVEQGAPGRPGRRAALLRALAPGRRTGHCEAAADACSQEWLQTTGKRDAIEAWMQQGPAEARRNLERLVRAWVGRVGPPCEVMALVAADLVGEGPLPRGCDLEDLLLTADLASAVLHLVTSGEAVSGRMGELAQISHLLARWHMPDHLKTKRCGSCWLQWMAVVVPAYWRLLLWAYQLRGGERRRRRARRGARFLHPAVQHALSDGRMAPESACAGLRAFLVEQARLSVSPPGEEACLYVLASRCDVYVGLTSTTRACRQPAGYGAACGFWARARREGRACCVCGACVWRV